MDEAQRIIVAAGVTQKASDVEALLPMLEQGEANRAAKPPKLSPPYELGHSSCAPLMRRQHRSAIDKSPPI